MKHAVKLTEDVQSKSEAFKEEGVRLVERLLEEKYSRPEYEDVALGIDERYNDPRTRKAAANTIMKMDNQERFFEGCLRKMNEATFTANFGATPQAIIRSIRVANMNSVIEHIADVQVVTSMVGMVGYVKPVFSRSIRGATAGEMLVESKSRDYSAENLDESIATTVNGDTDYSATLTYYPIRPGKVKVVFDGYEVGEDNGSGLILPITGQTILSEATGAVNTINYTTGEVTVTLAANPGAGKDITINYNYDTEQNTDAHGTVELVWASEGVTMEMNPLSFQFSLTSMLLAQSANFSVEEVLNDASTQFLKAERDRRGVDYNVRLALANAALAFDASPSAGGDNNNKMRAQMLGLKLTDAANAMYTDTNRGGISYIIAGAKANAYMELMDSYVKDESSSPIGCYLAGYLGKAPVVKAQTSKLATNEIIVGYKSEWGEAPFIFADYLDYATETLTLRDFISQKGLASFNKLVKVNPKFARKIVLNNLPA